MTILVTGANGTIGAALTKHLGAQGITRQQLDLSAPVQQWPALPAAGVAFLCAAVTKLDACEDNPKSAYLINVTRTKELARRMMENGTFVVFLSTNQVFDGETPYAKADAPPSPRNEYGRQKAELEAWLLAKTAPAAVLRLTKVVAGALPIVARWEEALKGGSTVDAFTDLIFAPLPLASVLEGCAKLAREKKPGIYQLSGLSDVSYYDVACRVAGRLGVDAARVEKTRAVDAGIRPQFLPRHGTLDRATMADIKIGEFLDERSED